MIWLAIELALAAMAYLLHVAFRHSGSLRAARARWLQRGCRRVLRVFNVALRTAGTIPTRGLLVCNHLSYLDILVLGAIAPGAFVAKSEVKRWPGLGWFARLAGTMFVHRQKRHDVVRTITEMGQALDDGALVVLFPEGTSSGGETVLPFKSALLAPATRQEFRLTAAFIRYGLADGSVADEVCYWRDMTLLPHLLNLLGKGGLSAAVSFVPIHERSADRKELARQLHAEVIRLKEASADWMYPCKSSPTSTPAMNPSAARKSLL